MPVFVNRGVSMASPKFGARTSVRRASRLSRYQMWPEKPRAGIARRRDSVRPYHAV
jgi:hypothetical protein